MAKWTTGVLALAAALMTAMPAAAKDGRGTALTADDYVALQQLAAQSSYALDTAADQGQAFARLFTPDGVFSSKTGHPFDVRGRAQLAAFADGDLTHRGPAYVRDYVTNQVITPTSEGATGRLYVVWIEVGENGVPGAVRSGGHYEDVYVKTRDGWRIRSRTFIPSKLGDRDVYDPKRAK